MQLDAFTYSDLSIFHRDETYSVFHKLDFTTTIGGRLALEDVFRNPHSQLEDILSTQEAIQIILNNLDQWPSGITNGTILMIEKFLGYQLDPVPKKTTAFECYLYRVVHLSDYSRITFSIGHFQTFLKVMHQLCGLLNKPNAPQNLKAIVSKIKRLLSPQPVQQLLSKKADESFSVMENVSNGGFFHQQFRSQLFELIDIFSQLDAWYSMAVAMKSFKLNFPLFIKQDQPVLEASGLYHILLDKPMPYNIKMDPSTNFIFLTGANMAGKSTFIKAVGLSVFLAHLGMGVPALNFKLSLFDGILSNINVTDNLVKGESYFYNEVQRIKHTILKINDGKKWLVLIDELFKGTNIQDAMRCSTEVVQGLIRINQALFVLSTHLYEIGESLQKFPNISFNYFETLFEDEQLKFSYQLKEGISNDRLGYHILKREGVVDLLQSLGK
jgi:DNA mismatch repair ATPase MutS